MLLAAASTPLTDQSSDLVLVSKFVEALKKGVDKEAQSMLTSDVFIGDYHEKKRSSFAEFAAYARKCQLRKVTLAPISKKHPRMPIGVEWSCPYPDTSRHASFWFAGNQIRRIGWG